MSKREFINGAIILSIAGIVVKFLGFAFRIPLGRMIGAGGMGDYSPAYDVYAFLLVIATAGIPVAISKLVAEDCAVGRYSEAKKVFRTSQIIMLVIGISGFLVLFFGADFIADIFNMESSALAIRTIAPTLLFAPIMSSYRGYFQGLQDMKPTAISQIVEQLFRVVFGLLFAYVLFNNILFSEDKELLTENIMQSRGAAGACFGAVAGAAFGLIAVLIVFKIKKKHTYDNSYDEETAPGWVIAKKIIIIAIPITVAACIMPIVNLVDVTIVMRRLMQTGFEYETAKSMFGELTGFAAPIMSLPQILIQAIAVGLVPLIAQTKKIGEARKLQTNISLGYRTSIIITMPCAVGMFVLAEPVMILFYGNQVENAIPCLRIYAIAFIFLSITSVTTAMLQGIGKQNIPLINLVIGLCGKVIVTWFLTGIIAVNVKGAAIGTAVAYFIAAGLDIIALKKNEKVKITVKGVALKALVSSVIMGIAVIGIYKVLEYLIGNLLFSTCISILCGVLLYGLMAICSKMITKEELKLIPFAERILRRLCI